MPSLITLILQVSGIAPIESLCLGFEVVEHLDTGAKMCARIEVVLWQKMKHRFWKCQVYQLKVGPTS